MTIVDCDWSLSNPGPDELLVWLEPWAEEFFIPVQSTVALKASSDVGECGLGDIERASDHVVVWANAKTIEVFIDGQRQDSASAIVAIPDGLSKDILSILFAGQPSARLAGVESRLVNRASWMERLRRLFRSNRRPTSIPFGLSGGRRLRSIGACPLPAAREEKKPDRTRPFADIGSWRILVQSVGGSLVSEDARNSIYLWVGGSAFFGLFWAGLHFDLLGGVSDTWLWPVLGGLTLINLAQTAWGFWNRRASNSGNPDHG